MTLSARAELAQHVSRALAPVLPDARLDALVEGAMTELGGDAATLSTVSDQQVILGAAGAARQIVRCGQRTSLEDAVCTNVVRQGCAVAIEDARVDPRVSSLPVVRAGQLRAYLGVPVRMDGLAIGVLCVVTGGPRRWTPEDEQRLQGHAAAAATALRALVDGDR